MALLDSIRVPADIRRLSMDELAALASEIRDCVVESVSKNGGHLASNLGVAELTMRFALRLRFWPFSHRPRLAAVGCGSSVLSTQDAHRAGRDVSYPSEKGIGQRLPEPVGIGP